MKKSACMVKLGLLLLLALAFSLATGLERQQQRISDSLVRLHVVGSSNDRRDQDIKLLVRDAVLQESGEILAGAGDRADAMALLGEISPGWRPWPMMSFGSRAQGIVHR